MGDLNGDGKTDRIILLPGTYSSWGDAVVDVYAGCGGDRYVEVWGDETYAFDLELAKTGRTSAHGWRDLALLQRHGVAGDDYMFEELLRFDGRKYAAVPDSVFRVDRSASTRWYPDPPQ